MRRLLPPMLVAGGVIGLLAYLLLRGSPAAPTLPAGEGAEAFSGPPASSPERLEPAPLPPTEVERLVAGLSAQEPGARRDAAHAIALIGESARAAAGALLEALEREPDGEVRAKLLWALGELRLPTTADRFDALARTDPDPGARAQAARELQQARPLDPSDLLRTLAAERSPQVRVVWVLALSKVAAPAARGRLERLAVGDSDAKVRAIAVGGLTRYVAGSEGSDSSYRVLEDRLLRDDDALVRHAAGIALGARPDAATRKLLQRALETERNEELRNDLRDLLDAANAVK